MLLAARSNATDQRNRSFPRDFIGTSWGHGENHGESFVDQNLGEPLVNGNVVFLRSLIHIARYP